MNSKYRRIPGWFIFTVSLIIAIYDLSVFYLGILSGVGEDYTISAWVRRLNEEWPLLSSLLAFWMGALYGHLFLSKKLEFKNA